MPHIAAFLILCLVACGSAAADKAEAIHSLLGRYHELGLFNGSALVADNGTLVIKHGYGLANREWGIANTPDTKFRLGSISKQFTAVLILQLHDQGKLDLQAPITRYLPDYPARTGDKITIHHLLNHTSGIPGYTELPQMGEWARNPFPPAEFIKKFWDLELLFEPGAKFSYCNSGYFLLGYIIEKVAGMSYEKVLNERIFGPMGMKDSGYDLPSKVLAKRAAGYESTLEGYRNAKYLDMTLPYSGGSLYSTVEDMYRWDQGLYESTLLKPETKNLMFTPTLNDYGYGWEVKKKEGITTTEHGGGINGFNTRIVRELETSRLIVLLNNTGGAPLAAMSDGIRAILRGAAPKMPKPPAAPVLAKTYDASGIAAVVNQIRELKASADPQLDAGASQINRVAGYVLAKGKPAHALELAKLAAESDPKSAQAQMMLAHMHKAAGNKTEAIQAYGKALELSETPRGFPTIAEEIRKLSAPSK